MASVSQRHKVGVGLLGSGVVGEAIQNILFQDLKSQFGADVGHARFGSHEEAARHARFLIASGALNNLGPGAKRA